MKTLVLVDEEYGYRYYFLLTDLTLDQLVVWWTEQEHIDSEFINKLPGTLHLAETNEQWALYCLYSRALKLAQIHIFTDGDSLLTLPNKERIKHKGYDEHFYDSKPGNRVSWFDTTTTPPTWRYGYYNDKLEIVEDSDDYSFWPV